MKFSMFSSIFLIPCLLILSPARAESSTEFDQIPDKTFSWSIDEPAVPIGIAYEHRTNRFFANACVQGPLMETQPSGDLSLSLRSQYSEVAQELGLETEARFRTAVAGGKASAKFLQNSSENGYSISLIFKNQSQYFERFDTKEGSSITAREGFNDWKGDAKVFRNSCGTQYVSGVKRTASIYVQVVVRFTSKQALQEFKAEVEGDFNSGAYSGEIGTQLGTMQKHLSKQTKVDISVLQIGGSPGQKGLALCPGAKVGKIESGTLCGDYAVRCGGGDFKVCEKFLADVLAYAGGSFANQLKVVENGHEKPQNYAYNSVTVTTYDHARLDFPPPTSAGSDAMFEAELATLKKQFEIYFKPWSKANAAFNLGSPRTSSRQAPVVEVLFSGLNKIVTQINKGVMDCYSGGLAGCKNASDDVKARVAEAAADISEVVNQTTGESVSLTSPQDFSRLVDKFAAPENFTQYCDISDSAHPGLKYALDGILNWLKVNRPDDSKALEEAGDFCFDLNKIMQEVTELKIDGNFYPSDGKLRRKEQMDVTIFSKLPHLQSLEITNADITNISSLAFLADLQSLNLYKNRVKDACGIAALPELTSLSLRDNRLKSADCLYKIANLKTLDVRGNDSSIECPQNARFNCKSQDLSGTINSSDLDVNKGAPALGRTAVQLSDGSVLVAGGLTPVFNPPTESNPKESNPKESNPKAAAITMSPSWEMNICTARGCYTLDRMNTNRAFSTMTRTKSGEVVIAGGLVPTIEIFNSQSRKSSPSHAVLSSPKSLHTATLLANGKIVFIGGYAQQEPEELRTVGPTTTYDIYDPIRDAIVATGNLRMARAEHSATLLPDGRIVIAGGYGTNRMLDQIEILDPTSGRSVLLPARLKTPRSGHVAILDRAQERIYFVGGFTRKEKGVLSATDSVEILNLRNFAIESSSEKLSKPRGGIASVQVADDRYILLGGTASENLIHPFEICSEEKPSETKSPETKPAQPDAEKKTAEECREMKVGTLQLKLKSADLQALGNIDIFDINTSSIYEGGTLNHARAGMVAAPLNFSMDAILVFGGATTKPDLQTVPEMVVYK